MHHQLHKKDKEKMDAKQKDLREKQLTRVDRCADTPTCKEEQRSENRKEEKEHHRKSASTGAGSAPLKSASRSGVRQPLRGGHSCVICADLQTRKKVTTKNTEKKRDRQFWRA